MDGSGLSLTDDAGAQLHPQQQATGKQASRRRGWLLGPTGRRSALLDGFADLTGLHRAFFDEVGTDASNFLHQAGLRSSMLWFWGLPKSSLEDALLAGLDRLENMGWGRFDISSLREQSAEIAVVESLEAWSFLQGHHHSARSVCGHLSGMLAGLWINANQALKLNVPDPQCWEAQCWAQRHPTCLFQLGSRQALLDRGWTDPAPNTTVRWEMESLTRNIRTSVHELSTVQTKLAEREQAYQELIDHLNDHLVVLDRDKRVIFCNRPFLEYESLTVEQAIGMSPAPRIAESDRAKVEKIYDDLLAAKKETARYRLRRLTAEGNERFFESSARVVRDGQDNVVAVQILSRDVTERETARRELEKAHKELVQKQQTADQELRLAKLVHESLLPDPVDSDTVSVDVKYVPVNRVGGDYATVSFPGGGRHCLLTLCDVAGHGVASALLASRVNSQARMLGEQSADPVKITAQLNDFLIRHFSDTGLFVTFAAASIDLQTMQLRYCGAGHPGPILWRKNQGQSQILESQFLPLGIVSTFEPTMSLDQEIFLEPGDRLSLYTDGVTETRSDDGRELTSQGLAQWIEQSAHIPLFGLADHLFAQLDDFRVEDPVDDMSVLLVETKAKQAKTFLA